MVSKKIKFNYNLISKYRSALMGIAIIFIMFCHLDVVQRHHNVEITMLAKFLNTLTVGVDIFMFLSGYGLYYSYTNKKKTYFEFEKRRLLRVLPLYFVIGTITYIITDILFQHLSVGEFLKDLFFVSWFTVGSTKYWFILGISFFYLLFPFLYKCVEKENKCIFILFCIFWFLILEICCKQSPNIDYLKIALARLPIFIFGIIIGKNSFNNKKLSGSFAIIMMIIGYLAFFAFKRVIPGSLRSVAYYPTRGVLGVSIIITCIALFELAEYYKLKFNFVYKCLYWFGGVTLELYLFHGSYLNLLNYPHYINEYIFTAFVLPIISTIIICICRNNMKRI